MRLGKAQNAVATHFLLQNCTISEIIRVCRMPYWPKCCPGRTNVSRLHAPQGKQIGGGTERDAFDLKGPGSNQNRAAEIKNLKPNPGKVPHLSPLFTAEIEKKLVCWTELGRN